MHIPDGTKRSRQNSWAPIVIDPQAQRIGGIMENLSMQYGLAFKEAIEDALDEGYTAAVFSLDGKPLGNMFFIPSSVSAPSPRRVRDNYTPLLDAPEFSDGSDECRKENVLRLIEKNLEDQAAGNRYWEDWFSQAVKEELEGYIPLGCDGIVAMTPEED